MNRNTNAHFSELPKVDIKRSKFDRSFDLLTSMNVGDVVPIFVDEAYPGDTYIMNTSKIIRLQTLLTPMMGNLYADTYFFFVPNRLIWDHWEEFMGENKTSAWIPQATYTVPKLSVPPVGQGSNNYTGSLLDYLGYPVELQMEDPNNPGTFIPAQTGNEEISALPLRAYCKVISDWFVDENLTDPLNMYTGDATVSCTTDSSYINDVPHGGKPFRAAKFRDYFTSCLPSAQKGSPVLLPLGDKAPVFPTNQVIWSTDGSVKAPNGSSELYFSQFANDNTISVLGGRHNLEVAAGFVESTTSTLTDTSSRIIPNNLWADLTNATAATVNDLRFAFQLQKLLERDARSGSKYKEVIKGHFSVDTGDARLQRAEYLGGNRVPISINQVENKAQTSTDFLGDLGAYSVTRDIHSDFTKSISEHGIVIGVMVLRADHVYTQGLPTYFQREDRFSYYWPEFANIGEQPVSKKTLFLTGTGTFGFQEAYADLRYKPSMCSGEMRPYVSNNLGSWTLADDYATAPSLSDDWIREDPANVDRVLAVTSQVAHQAWANIWFDFKHVRPMPVYSVPGLIDHH